MAITNDYKISATREIYKGAELSWDSNRDVLCSHCDVENYFSYNWITISICSDCNKVQKATHIVTFAKGISVQIVDIKIKLYNV